VACQLSGVCFIKHTLQLLHLPQALNCCGCCVCIAEYGRPLAPGLFFNKNLSRHGKGAAALLYFGDRVRSQYACMWLAMLKLST
jgi:hypothetical protein